jgi:putative ABC transport system permease protein
MANLPLANLLHHKTRSILSALGISLGICMLVTLGGLARGTLYEIADRWQSVRTDLIVFPRGWGENAADKSGSALSDKYADKITSAHADIVQQIVPVFTWNVKIGKQDNMVAGVEADGFPMLAGGRQLVEGRLFQPDYARFKRIFDERAKAGEEIGEADLQAASMLEMVIDSRLAAANKYHLGDTIFAANHHWKIVGIVPAGAMTRAFVTRKAAQQLFGSGDLTHSTLMFVKLKPGVDVGPAARAIAETVLQDVVPLDRYRGMLVEKFGVMFTYIDIVNVIALIIAFLFIMTTLYTNVLQRTREIAILKANGAGRLFILRQVLGEGLLLTAAGLAGGIALSFAAGWIIGVFLPLFTVTITLPSIGVACLLAVGGAMLAGLYPAWRATRVDMVEALTFE